MTALRKLSSDSFIPVVRKFSTVELLIEEIGIHLGMDLSDITYALKLKIDEAMDPTSFHEGLKIDRQIGKKIAEARKAAGFNQAALAAKLHITQGQLSKIESGLRGAPQDLVQKIATLCKKHYDFFFE